MLILQTMIDALKEVLGQMVKQAIKYLMNGQPI